MLNTVTIGYYKKGKITLGGENGDKLVLICKGFLSKTEIPMDKTTIRKVIHSILPDGTYEVIIEWKDGKLSQAIVDSTVFTVISEKIL